MPATMLIVSSLLVLVSILSPIYGDNIGDPCTVDNSSGVCKLLDDCPIVYNALLAGISPKKNCGYAGFDPIVCCPINQPTTTTTTTTTMIPSPQEQTVKPSILNGSRGSLAREMCAENAKAVYALVTVPTPVFPRPRVNISLCATKTRKLIVGGKKADSKEFPHMAAIGYDSPNGILWRCGGTLISSKIVLTAAHCTWVQEWGNANWVRLGDLNLAQTNDDAVPQTIAIKERIRHPDYKRPKAYHDIAVLRLEKEATYDAYTRPACLPVDLPDVDDSNKAVATGWGLVDWYDDEGSENLLKVTLTMVSQKSCNTSYFDGISSELPDGIVDDWQLCAGEPGKDTCQGDSGGPLAVFNKVHYCVFNVIGVTSLGRFCGSSYPGIYTRVYNYIPWIETTAWPEYSNKS